MSQPPYGPPPGPQSGPQPGMPPYGPPGMAPQGPPHGMPQPGAPYPPPQRSSGATIAVVIIGGVVIVVLAVVALVLLLGSGGDDDRGDGPPPPAQAGEAGIGDTVSRDRLDFVVTDVQTNVEISGHTPEEGEFIAVYIDVYNHSSSEEDFWSDEQTVYMLDGQSFGYDSSAFDSYSPHGTAEHVQPGEYMEAVVVFDIPDSSQLSHIGLSEETLGGSEIDVDLTGVQSGGGGGSAEGGGDSEPGELSADGIGETVSRDRLDFTVTRVETNVDISGETPDEGEFVAVYIDVYNHSDLDESFWSDEQVVYTLDGESYNYDSSAHSSYSPHDTLEYVDPGDTMEAVVVFDIPDSSQLSHIGLSEETLGGSEVDVDLSS